ncbi:hypothetical protein FEM48_Zijuj12G0192500 [Ziziphus jujuba var. spinosa]|uniref:Uncharacterized protein n=1 Tax=Ziziphus jujuba var. spinosa TaxID=714518 RepID=A0A978UF23_ZIZJJ|nr:hypothetical protein FEM48_Zijuj12G0192500 [Ziziphus jujuba var. spinosa]
MAGAYCAACAFLTPTVSLNPKRMKLLVLASSSTSEKPTKRLKRKNYLRPKILKPSTEPYSTPTNFPLSQETLQNPVIPIISPEITQHELPAGESGDICGAVSGEDDKVDEYRFSETSGGYDGKISIRSVIKYGFFFIGAFVFQTICAVWVLGSANSDKRDRNSENSDSGKGKVLLNGNGKFQLANLGPHKNNVGYVDEWELDGKIEEIRAMAREARKSEKKEFNEGSGVVVDESSNSRHRTGIEKEIGGRLKKLQKRLNSDREKSLGSYASYLGGSQKGEAGVNRNSSDSRDGNGKLIFKKKFKFRSPSTETKKSPKGFGVSQENTVSKRKKGGLGGVDKTVENERVGDGVMELSDRVNEEIQPEGEEADSRSLVIKESILSQNNQKTNGADEMGNGICKPRKGRNGIVQESGLGRSSIEVAKSGALREFGEDGQTTLKEDESNVMEFNPALSVNGSQRNRKAENRSTDREVQDKKSNTETDMWWLNLPYVLVVLMRQVSNPEVPEGFYTLKISSQSQKLDDSAYTIAFEDHGDANNFCFLLESFFEDLDDFRADVIPLPVKELHAAVNSNRWKVIVIRKGQLQLYAGQPFADVEMALQSLVEGNQID